MAVDSLAIIAGQGELPDQLLTALKNTLTKVSLICIEGQTPKALSDAYPDVPACWVQLGQIGKVLDFLKQEKAEHLVMIGGLRRPSWDELKLDSRGMKIMAKLALKPKGDDALLKVVIAELEKEGLKILGIQDVLPNILGEKGVLTTKAPTDEEQEDITQAWDALDKLSELDVGQSMVVQQGLILAVEAIEGTDAMIERAGQLKRKGRAPVLVKRPKVNQEKRADLPTLGLKTIEGIALAGIAGVVFEAKKTLLVDQEAMVAKANDLGLFIVGK